MRRFLATLLLLPSLAAAQPLRATYEVQAGGMTLLQLEAVVDLSGSGYRLETVMRTRGIAASFAPGEQSSRVAGAWAGLAALPGSFVSEGTWRGRMRRIALDWQGRDPRIRDLTPSETVEREPVPEDLLHGTVDLLSAIAVLARGVAETGRCEVTAPVFDGRRRSDFAVTTQGWERLAPWRGAWAGTALRCAVEGRQVAGFRRDQDRAWAATPQRGTAWIAAPYEGAPSIPVRVDIPTRWFGTATALLLKAEPIEQRR
jgi:hypothetical protein